MVKTFTITKKIAKHGNQVVIVIPTFLQQELKPQTVAEVTHIVPLFPVTLTTGV